MERNGLENCLELGFASQRLSFIPVFKVRSEEYAAIAKDYYRNVPDPIDEAELYMKESKQKWQEGTGFSFAVFDSRSHLLGVIGFELSNDGLLINNIEYWFGKKYHGQGFATESLEACLHFIKNSFPAVQLVKAFIVETNLASRRVLEKCGFHELVQDVENRTVERFDEKGNKITRINFELVI